MKCELPFLLYEKKWRIEPARLTRVVAQQPGAGKKKEAGENASLRGEVGAEGLEPTTSRM